MSYDTPTPPPINPKPEELVQLVWEEFSRVATESRPIVFPPQTAAPTNPTTGEIAFADGTLWNPGSGEGLYVWRSGSWRFIA